MRSIILNDRDRSFEMAEFLFRFFFSSTEINELTKQ